MPRAARPAPVRFSRPALTPADVSILRALARYPYLSSRQVCRLLYRYPASLSWAQAKLKHLTDLGFLERVFLPRPTQFGSAPSLYALARPGRACLEASGLDV